MGDSLGFDDDQYTCPLCRDLPVGDLAEAYEHLADVHGMTLEPLSPGVPCPPHTFVPLASFWRREAKCRTCSHVRDSVCHMFAG
jgi:hypothetical protein